jgi:hypothetical protein
MGGPKFHEPLEEEIYAPLQSGNGGHSQWTSWPNRQSRSDVAQQLIQDRFGGQLVGPLVGVSVEAIDDEAFTHV